jgi:DNA-binding beta-propeller fold protein YncE
VIAELPVPTSVIGPPSSVAITPNGALALVTAAMKVDPANPTQTIFDDRVTVIDLTAASPVVVATLRAGPGPSGIGINRAGTLALTGNRGDGTVSVFTIAGKSVTPAGTVNLGAPASIPSAIAFTADGRRAFVTRFGDSLISVLQVEGSRVTYAKTDFAAAARPYQLEITPAGDLAVVGHVGAGSSGGADLLSLIDLVPSVPRAINHVTAGSTVEGVAISTDGRYVAATVMNGSSAPKASGFFNDFGRLRIFAIESRLLTPVAETRIGHWCQGVAWSRNGQMVIAQCPVERELQLFRFDGRALTPAGSIKASGGPVGIRAQP